MFGAVFAGAIFGWFAYIQAASVAPIEVLAAIQYMSSASWAKGFYSSSGSLTAQLRWGSSLTRAPFAPPRWSERR